MKNALKIALPALKGRLATEVFVSCVASLLAIALFTAAAHFAERPIKEPQSASRRLADMQDMTTAFVFNAARAHSVGLKRATSVDAEGISDDGASASMHIAGNIADPELAK